MSTKALNMLAAGGRVAQKLPDYEPRPQQIAMAEAVAAAFDADEHLVVEAGTGVGKSFAYLIPTIDKIIREGGRAVVSTQTIALQEQLISKDIPFLQKVLPQKFSAILIKGRSNYVGLRRLARASQRQELLFPTAEREELWAIEDWAYKTKDGSLADLPQRPDPAVWDMVKSERTDCMGRRCPHYKRCFFQQARRRAADAQLLVVNHALLFSDLSVRQEGASILPDYQYVVLDEAHTVERVASEHFGLSVSDAQIWFMLNGLYNERTGRGVLAHGGGKALAAMREARSALKGYFDELAMWHAQQSGWNGRLAQPPPVENRATPALHSLLEALQAVRKEASDEDARFELASMAERCRAFAAAINALHSVAEEGCVYWLEVEPSRRRHVTLNGRPVDVGPALKEALFDKVKSAVLTSATLTTGGDPPFGYVQRRVGLNSVRSAVLGSPFDFRRQVTVYIEPNMPEPADTARFTTAAAEAMKKYLLKTEGRAFVLFTSYAMLQRCADLLKDFIAEHRMKLLVQGSGMPRSRMLEKFRRGKRSVLFGTDSFWGGVDVAGETLSNVIIVKLPFAVPTHPIMQARIEHIRKSGGQPFMDYQVPEAVLKFKQGFGRLIRTRKDKGIVVILDPRVRTKAYGRRFLQALPDCEIVDGQSG